MYWGRPNSGSSDISGVLNGNATVPNRWLVIGFDKGISSHVDAIQMGNEASALNRQPQP